MSCSARNFQPRAMTTYAARTVGVTGLIASMLLTLALAGCTAGPTLRVYTLLEEPASNEEPTTPADPPPPPPGASVIEVARVSLPDYIDSRDIVVRNGDLLERSSTGRWANRLSVAATDLITAQLATRRPDAWVTDQVQARPPDYRLMIHISRLDITSTGTGTLEADWEIVPRSASEAVIRRRIRFTMNGSVETDERVAHFERALLERLSREIDDSTLHAAPTRLSTR